MASRPHQPGTRPSCRRTGWGRRTRSPRAYRRGRARVRARRPRRVRASVPGWGSRGCGRPPAGPPHAPPLDPYPPGFLGLPVEDGVGDQLGDHQHAVVNGAREMMPRGELPKPSPSPRDRLGHRVQGHAPHRDGLEAATPEITDTSGIAHSRPSLPVPSQSRQRRLDVARARASAAARAKDEREPTRFHPRPRHPRHRAPCVT